MKKINLDNQSGRFVDFLIMDLLTEIGKSYNAFRTLCLTKSNSHELLI